jgi:hypothetical protein
MHIAAHSTSRLLRRPLVALAAAIVVFSLAAASNVTAAHAAARSTNVTLVNQTGCDLNRTAWHLSHGKWSIAPPSLIGPGEQVTWRSRSSGIATGTEGRVTYRTSDCENPDLKRKDIRIHWNNPFVGGNSYDYNGTDPAFRVPHTGGSGNQANVTFFAQLNV